MGDTSLHRASNQKDWTHGWIFASLRPQASQWKDTDYNMRSSDYMQYASHGFPGWFWTFWGICKVWLQTRMCLDAISQKIKQTHMCLVTRSNVRVCVWYLSTTNACMFDPKRFPNANVCGMCAERVSCVSCVDKNRAYAYVYASLSQTRCVCTQIYIKNIANTHVLCALLRYHNKRACVWLENWKRLRLNFHCSSLFGFPCCAAFSSACCRSHERREGNGGNPPGRRDEWAGFSDWSCTWLWPICVAYGRN